MKNFFRITFSCALIFAVCIVNPLRAQTTQKSADTLKSIPADVMSVLKKSCFGCHAEPGKSTAMLHLNFTKWDEYSAEKQASKAKDMCSEVTKDKMPPKKFRENNPEAIPTKEEMKILCEWAEMMQKTK
jgi:hypothetical protein